MKKQNQMAELSTLVSQNPEISTDEARKLFPLLTKRTVESIVMANRRKTLKEEYIDPGTGKVYYSALGLSMEIGVTEKAIKTVIERRRFEYIIVFQQNKIGNWYSVRFYSIEDLLDKHKSYQRRYTIRKVFIANANTLLKEQPADLDQVAWLVLLTLLICKNLQDRWLTNYQLYVNLLSRYRYELYTVEHAVKDLVKKGYLVVRFRGRNREHNSYREDRTFWATEKCPRSLITIKVALESMRFRDYVKPNNDFNSRWNRIQEQLT